MKKEEKVEAVKPEEEPKEEEKAEAAVKSKEQPKKKIIKAVIDIPDMKKEE